MIKTYDRGDEGQNYGDAYFPAIIFVIYLFIAVINATKLRRKEEYGERG